MCFTYTWIWHVNRVSPQVKIMKKIMLPNKIYVKILYDIFRKEWMNVT